MPHKLVSFIGLIGSGKTTAANVLTGNGFVLFEEDFGNNAFLPDYYKDMKRWAFHSQMYFLINKIKQNAKIMKQLSRHHIAQDFPLYQDLAFARTCFELGNMTAAEWSLYYDTFLLLNKGVKQPDLIVYLKVTPRVALKRIMKRGRPYELSIPESYLVSLKKSIEELIETNPSKSDLMVIDADKLNFADSEPDIHTFTSKILDARLYS